MAKKQIQIRAYRRLDETDSVGDTRAFSLDVDEKSTISVNYKFADIKEPQKRSSSFTQTFKLPFTPDNNKFFEHWYNVNREKLVFSQNDKISCDITVGGNLVLSGNLQLLGIFMKAEYYDCAVVGEMSTLFTVIGSKTLKRAFQTYDETTEQYLDDTDLNHDLTETATKESWSATLQNLNNDYIRDQLSTGDYMSKVLYPIRGRGNPLIFDDEQNSWLNNTGDDLDADGDVIMNFTQDEKNLITSLAPALQLRTVLQKIFAKAGFTWTSDFLDSDYFRKLYMTTCDWTSVDAGMIFNTLPDIAMQNWWVCAQPSSNINQFFVYNDYYLSSNLMNTGWDYNDPTYFTGNATGGNVLTAPQFSDSYGDQIVFSPTVGTNVSVWFACWLDNSVAGATNVPKTIQLNLVNPGWETIYYWNEENVTLGTGNYFFSTFAYFSIDEDIGSDQFYFSLGISNSDGSLDGSKVGIGTSQTLATGERWRLLVATPTMEDVNPFVFPTPKVRIPPCIDPSITQKDFLKDLTERFNLVFEPNPEDPTNVLIEPFSDYLGKGEDKYWTDKIDAEKEIIVRPTTKLQKQEIRFSDKESDNLLNKWITNEMPELSVYGNYYRRSLDAYVSEGTLKNKPIFTPYLVRQIPNDWWGVNDSIIEKLVVQEQYTYTDEEQSIVNTTTPPMLFYYNGTPMDIPNDVKINFWLHKIFVDGGYVLERIQFDTFPLCTPYELDNTNGIQTSSRNLYWGDVSADWIQQSSVFGIATVGTSFNLYNTYWKQYLNELYNEDSRIMTVYLYLNSSDIANFKFNDKIFLKDTYWRIVEVKSYTVGDSKSTKVTLLKSNDLLGNLDITEGTNLEPSCDYIYQYTLGSGESSAFLWLNPSGILTTNTTEQCCINNAGYFTLTQESTGLGICSPANSGNGTGGPLEEINDVPEMMMSIMINNGPSTTDKYSGKSYKIGNVYGGGKKARGSGLNRNSMIKSKGNVDRTTHKYGGKPVPLSRFHTKTGLYIPPKEDEEKCKVVRFYAENIKEYVMGTRRGDEKVIALRVQGDARNQVRLEPNTFTLINVKLMVSVVSGAVDVGKCAVLTGTQSYKIKNGAVTHLSPFPIGDWTTVYSELTTITLNPQMAVIPTKDNRLMVAVQYLNGQAGTQVNVSGEVVYDIQSLHELTGTSINSGAMFQNLEQIEFQDNTDMLWN